MTLGHNYGLYFCGLDLTPKDSLPNEFCKYLRSFSCTNMYILTKLLNKQSWDRKIMIILW